MKRVVLIYPCNISNRGPTHPPLGILYLAGILLGNEIDVIIIDESMQKNSRKILLDSLSAETICVGISTMSGRMLKAALDVASFVRQHQPNVPIVWGGVHPTLEPQSTLQHDLCDAVCIGEGEVSFLQMIRAYNKEIAFKDIKGIGFKEKGEAVFTAPRDKHFELDKLPSLPYHLLDLEAYYGPNNFFGFKSEKVFALETSRGCPYRCCYCVQALQRQPMRHMSADTVLRFIQDGLNAGFEAVAIMDDNFFANEKLALETMHAISMQNWSLEMYASPRADYLCRVDDHILELMQKIGLTSFCVGAESGSDRMLKLIGKGEKIDDIFKANRRLAHTGGFHPWFVFITGFPFERLEDTIETYKAMTRIVKENPFARTNNKKLIPTPNTPVFNECLARGMKKPETIEEWIEIEDLRWEKHASYTDQDVENFFCNTRYYDLSIKYLSSLRAPYATMSRRLLLYLFTPIFYLFSWIMNIRYRRKEAGKKIDTHFFDFLSKKARVVYLKNYR